MHTLWTKGTWAWVVYKNSWERAYRRRPLFLFCCLLDAVSVRHTKAFIHAPLGHIHDSRSRRTDYPLGLIQLMRALHKFHVPCNNARARAPPQAPKIRWNAVSILCSVSASGFCIVWYYRGWAKSGWQSLVMCEMCGFNIIYVYSYAWHDDTHDMTILKRLQ